MITLALKETYLSSAKEVNEEIRAWVNTMIYTNPLEVSWIDRWREFCAEDSLATFALLRWPDNLRVVPRI